MAGPSILAVDFSKRSTGLAFGRPGERPVLSSISFAKWEGASLAEASSAIIRWLPEALGTFAPDLIVVEAALPPIASREQISARLALGFDFLLKGAAHLRTIRCEEVAGGTWKAFSLGCGNLPSAEAKRRSMAVCKGMGWEAANNDEADAACVWIWAEHEYGKFRRDNLLPIFSKVRAA